MIHLVEMVAGPASQCSKCPAGLTAERLAVKLVRLRPILTDGGGCEGTTLMTSLVPVTKSDLETFTPLHSSVLTTLSRQRN